MPPGSDGENAIVALQLLAHLAETDRPIQGKGGTSLILRLNPIQPGEAISLAMQVITQDLTGGRGLKYRAGMTVEAAELKEHLGEYLQKIRSTGEVVTICHGAELLATLSPIRSAERTCPSNLIDRLLAAPLRAPGFQPLTRDQIYERK